MDFKQYKDKRVFKVGATMLVLGSLTIGVAFAFAATPKNQVLTFNNASTSGNANKSGGNVNFGAATSPTTQAPVTTQPQTTTTMMNHGSGFDVCPVGIGKQGSMGPCIDKSKIPAPGPSISTSVVANTGQPFKEVGGEAGAFRTKCDYSHMSNDDPIVYPGQSGAAHLHVFFGNTGTNSATTPTNLLNSGNSTCSGGTLNRSAYWVPAMIDTSIGRPVRPSDPRGQFMGDLEVYYKNGYQGIGYGDIQTFPKGFEMIAGNLPGATSATPNSHVNYYCEDADQSQQSKRGTSIPVCNKGQILTMFIEFPQCWDGKNTTVPGARSHMAYGTARGSSRPFATDGCPSTHPIGLPVVEMFVRYYVSTTNTANWRLSSDNYTNGPGGYSGHADYMFAWDETVFPRVKKNCYNAQKDCLFGMGDGTEPKFMRTAFPWTPIYNN